jgi:hypothetical protein
MSARPGQVQETIVAAVALGTNQFSRVMALSNGSYAVITAIIITWVTNVAPAGARVPQVQIKDASGNLLWQMNTATTIPAASSALIQIGNAGTASTTPLVIFLQIPVELTVPPFSTITVTDTTTANQAPPGDNLDTIGMIALLAL